MGKSLVVVESPAKAKTINKILGADYVVKSSMGHVRDLPTKGLGVDIEKSFKPTYVLVNSRKKVVDDLRKAAESCDAVYLAPDPDREGEAIAWHLQAVLSSKSKDMPFYRVQYNEITPRAVRHAFEHPGQLDLHRVDAQQARRILDRLVGYMVSPMLWRRLRRGLSAGRVQSVALRLVCEREAEIRSFVPEEYWIIGAVARKLVAPLDPFRIKLVEIDGEKAQVGSEAQAGKVRADLEGRGFSVKEISTREVKRRPSPPFITSSLQQAASSRHGFSPSRTMALAQRLYEGLDMGEGPVGLITYMRTDSFSIAREAQEECRSLIRETYGEEYCPEPPNFYKSRASAQEAHEAIRPTDVTRRPEELAKRLPPPELKLYTLIWRRFVASQMSHAVVQLRTCKIEAVPRAVAGEAGAAEGAGTYLFQASASDVLFPGYMKVMGADQKKPDEDGDEVEVLPPLAEGESLECLEWLAERKETKPPARYSEAALIRAMESNGVGRPSTYAQTVSTLQQRKYVLREKRSLSATELGMQVNDLLVATLGELFNVKFTAQMEDSLDDVERGVVEWTRMLADFYARFSEWMERTKEPPADTEAVGRVLAALGEVREWAAPVKQGKRTYSDERFVTSVASQREKGERAVSNRQLAALAKIACRYRDQIQGVPELVTSLGMEEVLAAPDARKPTEGTQRKLGILAGVALNESARSFVDSLAGRVESGRALTEAQSAALDNVLMSHGGQIEDFERICKELDVKPAEQVEDNESGPLLELLVGIKEWREPTQRGKRVFDDKAFYESLSAQHGNRGFLTVRQRGALRRMIPRYREQIPDYAAAEDRFKLAQRQPREGKK